MELYKENIYMFESRGFHHVGASAAGVNIEILAHVWLSSVVSIELQ